MDEMKGSSTVIHKGKREEKYKICVEDYVMSYLQRESGNLELSEIFFYGYRTQNGSRYEIYGAGKDRHISFFDKYELLEEVVCRQTQAGPFFVIKEGNEVYEIQGYDVFYQRNEEMQEYMVASKKETKPQQMNQRRERKIYRSEEMSTTQREDNNKRMQGLISLQLCAIFILLTAIVITSTNSYDKMGELNQSAKEVFFAMENQAVQGKATDANGEEVSGNKEEYIGGNAAGTGAGMGGISGADGTEPASGENGAGAETASGENGTDTEAMSGGSGAATETASDKSDREEKVSGDDESDDVEAESGKDASAVSVGNESAAGNETQEEGILKRVETDAADTGSEEEGTEALSRNVTRYYEIKKGDTLFTISLEIYGDTSKVKQICELNQIADPDNIRYGQKIILP